MPSDTLAGLQGQESVRQKTEIKFRENMRVCKAARMFCIKGVRK